MQWAGLAPPFGAGVQKGGLADSIVADSEILWDEWRFSLCDDACTISHHLINQTVAQGAPARVTRGGLALPTVAVQPGTPPPYIVATRYPNGSAVLLTAMGRTNTSGWTESAADVTLSVPGPGVPPLVGLLGRYASVTLHFEGLSDFGGGPSVSGRDMVAPAGSERVLTAADGLIWQDAKTLRIDGSAVEQLGLAARGRPDDVSAPGLALWLKQ